MIRKACFFYWILLWNSRKLYELRYSWKNFHIETICSWIKPNLKDYSGVSYIPELSSLLYANKETFEWKDKYLLNVYKGIFMSKNSRNFRLCQLYVDITFQLKIDFHQNPKCQEPMRWSIIWIVIVTVLYNFFTIFYSFSVHHVETMNDNIK